MELDWVVGKALAKDLQSRYQSTVEFIVDLETLQTKLRVEDSRGIRARAPAGASGNLAAVAGEPLAGTRRSEGVKPVSAQDARAENVRTLRKRRLREMLLDFGGKGLLPDSILSQALEVMAGLDELDLEIEFE